MADWYFWDGGENQYGPMSRGDLDDCIQRHSNPNLIRVWRHGFPGWKTIEEAFVQSDGILSGPPTFERDDKASAQSASRNLVAKHWRGEFPLGIAYWVVGISCNILALLVIGLMGAFAR